MTKRIFILTLLSFLLSAAIMEAYNDPQRRKRTKKKTAVVKKKKPAKKSSTATFDANEYTTRVFAQGDTLKWIEQQLAEMNDTQRIGQLITMQGYTNKDSVLNKKLPELISTYGIGGIIIMQGTPYRDAVFINRMQGMARTPMLMSVDGEWGLGMRVDSVLSFPHQLTLGAIQNDSLIEQMGFEVGMQCRRIGIQINFAPVVDINNNPNNPVINDRSFGENADNVTRKGLAYMKGMQRAGIMACAKHFPGHGDTDVDSHKDLPVLPFGRERLDSLELIPFKALIAGGVQSVMVAHLAIPKLEPNAETPASLSQKIVTNLLKKELGFEGLTITDAMNMKGVTKNFADGNADLKALLAGNDMLLISEDVPAAVTQILKAIKKGLITQDEIDNRARKILYYKYKLGLSNWKPIAVKNLQQDLNKNTPLITRLYSSSITQINFYADKKHPENTDGCKLDGYASVSIGSDTVSGFQKTINTFLPCDNFKLSMYDTDAAFDKAADSLKKYCTIFIDVHSMSRFASRDYGLSYAAKNFIKKVYAARPQTCVVLFGNPYSLKFFDDAKNVVIAYEDNAITQQVAAGALFGQSKINGKLPVTASPYFVFGNGNTIEAAEKKIDETLKPFISKEISGNYLKKIDDIATEGITKGAYPGCEIVVMKDGKLFFQKSYGYFTYEKQHAVKNTDLYDLASITKIASTTLCCMKLYEEGRLDLNKTIADYLPEAKKTNKKKIKVRDLLLHQAGLTPFIPFYKNCLDAKGEWKNTLATKKDAAHDLQVAENLFIESAYEDTMWQMIYATDLKTPGKYVYSDLDMYFMKRICDKILAGETTDEFVNRTIYQPMQLKKMCFNPLLHGFTKNEIAPTEDDKLFRKQLVCGCVHDPGAAMCGGIQGHAGLFSDAIDLATLMAMLNNGGSWNGKQYFKKETVDLFTSKQSKVSRRGLGFDKQSPQQTSDSPTCASASTATFGHTGFTGTSAWADPKTGLVFIFLSNRVYPVAENKKIITLGTRTNLQEVFYEMGK